MKFTYILPICVSIFFTLQTEASSNPDPCLVAMKEIALEQHFFGVDNLPSEISCNIISRGLGNCLENVNPAFYKLDPINKLYVYKDRSSKEITKYIIEKGTDECQKTDKCHKIRLEYSEPKSTKAECSFGRVERVTLTPEGTEKNRFTFYTEALCSDFKAKRLPIRIDGPEYIKRTPDWTSKFSLSLKSSEPPLAEINRFYKNCRQFCRDCDLTKTTSTHNSNASPPAKDPPR